MVMAQLANPRRCHECGRTFFFDDDIEEHRKGTGHRLFWDIELDSRSGNELGGLDSAGRDLNSNSESSSGSVSDADFQPDLQILKRIAVVLLNRSPTATGLSQTCKLNYGRQDNYITWFEKKGYLKWELEDKRRVAMLTEKGRKFCIDLLRLFGAL
jgi:predicted transcriptional regulator